MTPGTGFAQETPDGLPVFYYDYFFNREGRLLAYRPNITANHYFLLRNARTQKNLYAPEDMARAADTTQVQPADVFPMSHLHKAARQARKGRLDAAFVDTAFVPVLSVDVLLSIRNMIRKRERRDPLRENTDWREYGGYYDSITGKVMLVDSSDALSPCDTEKISVDMGDSVFSFHSHPSGEGTKDHGVCYFMSPPSLKDQHASSYINYVYGMREHMLFVCSKQGLLATVRFRLFRKHRRKKMPAPLYSSFTANARFSIKGIITSSKASPTPHS
jgi:hypothetical protein